MDRTISLFFFQHIHHPSLISLTTSFLTPLYTVLVLDYAPGGELFDFLASWHTQVTVPLARRIFGELCAAVGWMHEIGLVHRDIKLESECSLFRLQRFSHRGSPSDFRFDFRFSLSRHSFNVSTFPDL